VTAVASSASSSSSDNSLMDIEAADAKAACKGTSWLFVDVGDIFSSTTKGMGSTVTGIRLSVTSAPSLE